MISHILTERESDPHVAARVQRAELVKQKAQLNANLAFTKTDPPKNADKRAELVKQRATYLASSATIPDALRKRGVKSRGQVKAAREVITKVWS